MKNSLTVSAACQSHKIRAICLWFMLPYGLSRRVERPHCMWQSQHFPDPWVDAHKHTQIRNKTGRRAFQNDRHMSADFLETSHELTCSNSKSSFCASRQNGLFWFWRRGKTNQQNVCLSAVGLLHRAALLPFQSIHQAASQITASPASSAHSLSQW